MGCEYIGGPLLYSTPVRFNAVNKRTYLFSRKASICDKNWQWIAHEFP